MEEDDKENSADETEENAGMDEVKTPKKAGKTKKNDKANTEVKKDKKKKEKKRKSLAQALSEWDCVLVWGMQQL